MGLRRNAREVGLLQLASGLLAAPPTNLPPPTLGRVTADGPMIALASDAGGPVMRSILHRVLLRPARCPSLALPGRMRLSGEPSPSCPFPPLLVRRFGAAAS